MHVYAPPCPPYNAVAKSSPFFPGPVGRPSYYYCNCKEGFCDTGIFWGFRAVTGLVEGSLASDFYSTMLLARVFP